MVKFANEDICQICEKTLFFYFSSILNLVYNEPCFFDIVLSIPMEIIEYENLKGHMGCFKYKSMVLGESCSTCVNYIIEHWRYLICRQFEDYPMNSYVPTKPTVNFYYKITRNDV